MVGFITFLMTEIQRVQIIINLKKNIGVLLRYLSSRNHCGLFAVSQSETQRCLTECQFFFLFLFTRYIAGVADIVMREAK